MRLFLLLALVLLVLPACDSTPSGEGDPPEEEFVGVRITYTVSFTGTTSSASVRYTDEDKEEVVDSADFTRLTEYSQEVVLAPETAGTFLLQAEGFVIDGTLSATIQANRLDDNALITIETQTSPQTSGSQEVTALASVVITPVVADPNS